MLRATEIFRASPIMQAQPVFKTSEITALHQEEPPKAGELLRQQLLHSTLPQDITAVAVCEKSLSWIIGKLRVHLATENRLELVGTIRV